MLAGETIQSGANPTCEECGQTPDLGVKLSADGWYIGLYCHCGPSSRESDYYRTREDAEVALIQGNYHRSSGARP